MSLQDLAPAWLGRALRAAGQDISNLLSLVIFFSVVALMFRSVEFALVVTASLGFHELGHAAALILYRQACRVHFGVVGAWTWSSADQRRRLSQLSNAYIHLAGPFFSLLLALLALALYRLWLPGDRHLLILANFSAQVGFLNLLPLGPVTDGGKIIRRMMRSLDTHDDARRQRVIWLPTVIAVLMLALYGFVQLPHMAGDDSLPMLAGLLLVGLWMSGSMVLETRPHGLLAGRSAVLQELIPQTGGTPRPSQPAPMSASQVTLLTLLLWDMLVLYLVIISITPFWLEPDYVRGSLLNIIALLRLLFGLV